MGLMISNWLLCWIWIRLIKIINLFRMVFLILFLSIWSITKLIMEVQLIAKMVGFSFLRLNLLVKRWQRSCLMLESLNLQSIRFLFMSCTIQRRLQRNRYLVKIDSFSKGNTNHLLALTFH